MESVGFLIRVGAMGADHAGGDTVALVAEDKILITRVRFHSLAEESRVNLQRRC